MKGQKFTNINKAKELHKSNNILDTARLLKGLWKEKDQNPDLFSKSKRDIYDSSMEKFVHEFSLVNGISVDKARKRIDFALKS